MPYTVQNLLTDLRRKVAPAEPRDSRDIFGCIADGASNILAKIKIKDLTRRAIIENALYDQVNRFKCPDDVDKNNIAQWFKLNGGTIVNTFNFPMRQVSNTAFDYNKKWDANLFTIEYQSGVKFIKVSDPSLLFGYGTNQTSGAGVVISTMDDVTGNGTWNTSGNIVDIVKDNLTHITGSGSLRFNINNSTTQGSIFNNTLTPVDISNFLNTGKVFTWLELPNLAQIQTVELRLGSSLTDYYSITVSAPHDTVAFQTGWNLLGFELDRSQMNTIGLPNPASISHCSLNFTTNGTLNMSDIRVDNIVVRGGTVFGIQYISNSIFEDTNGLWMQRPQDNSDIIHLEYDAYDLILASTAVGLAQELTAGNKGGNLVETLTQDLNMKIRDYKMNNKEEAIDEQQFMYTTESRFGLYGNGRNSRSIGWNGNNLNNL